MDIVVNSSPLIALGAINKLDLLGKLFNRIYIPDEVFTETVVNGKNILIGEQIAKEEFFRKEVCNRVAVELLADFIDKGESEVIVLAKELWIPLVLMDDLRGRRVAERQNLRVLGSTGVLLMAKRCNLLSSVSDCINQMRAQNI